MTKGHAVSVDHERAGLRAGVTFDGMVDRAKVSVDHERAGLRAKIVHACLYCTNTVSVDHERAGLRAYIECGKLALDTRCQSIMSALACALAM